MDEVDNCMPMASSFLMPPPVLRVEKAAPLPRNSGLLLDVPAHQGQCLPPISSLLKEKQAFSTMRCSSPAFSDCDDLPTEQLKSCEILDDSITEDSDPGLPPSVPTVRFYATSTSTTKIHYVKTPRRRIAPVYRRAKNPELRARIMQSCASLLSSTPHIKNDSCEKIYDKLPEDEVSTPHENAPTSGDENIPSRQLSQEESVLLHDTTDDENIPPCQLSQDENAPLPELTQDTSSDEDNFYEDVNETETSFYYYEDVEGSDHSWQDMEIEEAEKCLQIEGQKSSIIDCDEITENHAGAEKVMERMPLGDVTNQWVPISEETSIISSAIIPSQEADRELCNLSPTDPSQHNQYRFRNHFTTPISLRRCPLPSLDWAESRDVWMAMLKKDTMYYRDPHFLNRHPNLQAKMRSILLDWLTEVCEVYRLHRETYYLAADFIDRYMTNSSDTVKQQLQLIGITALFIAAKAEEIYPPKLSEFAYVTDGACSESEILQQELVMLKVLNWDLTPMTVNAWLNLYLQLLNLDNLEDQEHGFIFPQYSAHAFIQIAMLLDLCLLDIGSLQFSYSTIASSALHHMLSENVALSLSGYQQMDISACVQWMLPFAMTVNEMGVSEIRYFPNISPDDAHNIQMHNVTMDHLESVQARAIAMASQSRSSPDVGQLGVLTPPQSGKKCQESLV